MLRVLMPSLTSTKPAQPRAQGPLDPPRKPTAHEPNSAARLIPNATYAAGGTIGTIAQTKYGAPVGWKTPVGQKGEGFMWTKPDGSIVYGIAPDIFTK